MTEAVKHWWDNFKGDFIPKVITPVGVCTLIFMYSGNEARNQQLRFSDLETKVITESHVRKAPSDVDIFIAQTRADSVARENLKKQDEILSFTKKLDSVLAMQPILKKNTVTLYQMSLKVNKLLYNQNQEQNK